MVFCIFRFFSIGYLSGVYIVVIFIYRIVCLSFISTWRELLVKVVRVFFLRICKNFLHKHQFARAMRECNTHAQFSCAYSARVLRANSNGACVCEVA